MNNLSGLLLVWRNTLRTALRGKRLLVLLALAVLPLLIAWVVSANAKNVSHGEFMLVFMMVVCQVTLPFGSLFLGVAALGDEIDGRTITFLFTRPLPRTVFYFGRLLGFATAFGLLVAASTLFMSLILGSRLEISGTQMAGVIGIALAGMVAYMAFFAALRTLTKKAILVGFVVTFILEFMLSKAPPGNGAQLTVWHHLSRLTANVFRGQARFEGPLENLRDVPDLYDLSSSVYVLANIIVVSMFVGWYVVKTREIRVSATVS